MQDKYWKSKLHKIYSTFMCMILIQTQKKYKR